MTHAIAAQKYNIDDSSLDRVFLAIFRGDYSTVRNFIAAKFDVNCRHPITGCTPLIATINLRHTNLVYDLVNGGADVNLKELADGETPLMAATKTSNQTVVGVLLNRGAKVDEVDNLGNTALILAAERSCEQTFYCLLSHGASVEMKNKSCETVLTHLLEGGTNRNNCLFVLLKGKKIDVEYKNQFGQTALIIAAKKQNQCGVQMLAECGANVLAFDKAGKLAVEYMKSNYFHDYIKRWYRNFLGVSVDRLLREWTMTLFPLGLPVYVMLWIFEKNEPVASAKAISEFKRISRIRGVVDSMLRIKAQKNLANKTHSISLK